MKSKSIEFIGIGAPKTGTTWLANCLKKHPQILFSAKSGGKELNFFNDDSEIPLPMEAGTNYFRGIGWYFDQFPPSEKGKIRGEFSNLYYWYDKSPQKIYDNFPNVKILAMLRDPVKMIYSLHWFVITSLESNAPKDFEKCLELGYYLDLGLYYKHLKKYFDTFPAKNIHVVLLDDVKENPEKAVSELYKFLDVDSNFMPDNLYEKINPSVTTRFEPLKLVCHKSLNAVRKTISPQMYNSFMRLFFLSDLYRKINVKEHEYPIMSSETEKKLKKYYRNDIEKLEKLLNKNLNAWK